MPVQLRQAGGDLGGRQRVQRAHLARVDVIQGGHRDQEQLRVGDDLAFLVQRELATSGGGACIALASSANGKSAASRICSSRSSVKFFARTCA
jgi:hypothetical protein